MTKGTPYQLYVADSTRERLDPAARRPRVRRRARGPRPRARDPRLGTERRGPRRRRARSLPGEALGARMSRGAQPLALHPVAEERDQRVAEGLARPAARAGGAAGGLGQRRRVRGDYGHVGGRWPRGPGARSPRSARGARTASAPAYRPGSSASGTAPSSRSSVEPLLGPRTAGDGRRPRRRRRPRSPQRPRRGHERAEVLARDLGRDAQHVRARPARGLPGCRRRRRPGGTPRPRRRRRR